MRVFNDLEVGIAQTKPGIVRTKPGIVKTKLVIAQTNPGIVKTKLVIAKTKPGIVRTKPGIVKTKPGIAKTKLRIVKTKLVFYDSEFSPENTEAGNRTGMSAVAQFRGGERRGASRCALGEYGIDNEDEEQLATNIANERESTECASRKVAKTPGS